MSSSPGLAEFSSSPPVLTVAYPLPGCSHAAQLHPSPATADNPPGAVPCSVPTRCCLPSHCPSHEGSHCCSRRCLLFPAVPYPLLALLCNVPFLTSSFLSALATLKPQAGLIVPQAVPSSQPSVVVSVPFQAPIAVLTQVPLVL